MLCGAPGAGGVRPWRFIVFRVGKDTDMIQPILACENPYETAKKLVGAGWSLDFSQPPESGDPLVGISLFDNSILLGVTEGYVAEDDKDHVGCGVEIYLTIPSNHIQAIHEKHEAFHPTKLELQPWGVYAFEVYIEKYKFMIAAA